MLLFNNERGFTIVDLVVTIVVLGILATAMATRFFDLSHSAEVTACKSNQMTLEFAQRLYYVHSVQTSYGEYATSLDDLKPYLRDETLPKCPSNGQYTILPRGEITCTIGEHQR
jgi:type II secretory pathway pseudopilin PulG